MALKCFGVKCVWCIAGLDNSFSHSPGFMFVCDSLLEGGAAEEQLSGTQSTAEGDHHEPGTVEVVRVTPERIPTMYSVLSSSRAAKVTALERLIIDDPGGRGVLHLQRPGSLLRSVLSLSHSKRVAVATGFPCMPGESLMVLDDMASV